MNLNKEMKYVVKYPNGILHNPKKWNHGTYWVQDYVGRLYFKLMLVKIESSEWDKLYLHQKHSTRFHAHFYTWDDGWLTV
jgi:hypothetical protein